MDNKIEKLTVGQKIRKYRKAKGKTQDELANELHIDRSKLSRLENDNTNLNLIDLTDIAHALGVSPGDFLGEGSTSPSSVDILQVISHLQAIVTQLQACIDQLQAYLDHSD